MNATRNVTQRLGTSTKGSDMCRKQAIWFGLLAGLAAVVTVMVVEPSAYADDGSYLGAVSSVYHSVYDNGAMLHFGHGICDDLHSGRTFQQEVEMAPATMGGYMDVPAVIGAAQHELCPDTLHG